MSISPRKTTPRYSRTEGASITTSTSTSSTRTADIAEPIGRNGNGTSDHERELPEKRGGASPVDPDRPAPYPLLLQCLGSGSGGLLLRHQDPGGGRPVRRDRPVRPGLRRMGHRRGARRPGGD